MTTYVSTADEILAVQPHADYCRKLVARSDALLERLETLNLGRYGALRDYAAADLEAVRLTSDLVSAINELLAEVGLQPRRLSTTRGALDAVYDAQARLFGTNDDEEDNEA